MPEQQSPLRLNAHLVNPLCSRHDHIMTYEKSGIVWKEEMDSEPQTLPSYHCDYQSCTVHYSPSEGYFTVVDAPDVPQFMDEPGVNVHTCPRHGTWLYQSRGEKDSNRFTWRCGVEDCDYVLPGNDRSGVVDHPNI